MGVISIISNIFEKRATKQTGLNPQNPSYWVQKLFGGGLGNTAAGINVNEENALSSTAVWRAVALVSQTIGALPLHMYIREGEKTKRKALNHHLYTVLHDEPNPEQTAMECREMLQAHALTWGRAHAEIAIDRRGKVKLWPLIPDRVEPMRTTKNTLVYRIHLDNGEQRVLLADEVFTIKGLGYGLNSTYNLIQLFKESIGLTLAAEEFGSRFFGNGATMGGVLEHPGVLKDESLSHLRQSINERHQGLSDAHRLLILEEGMKYKEIAVPPEKAQFLETRKYQINDVARIIGVPPHKLAEMSQSTFSNIEHQSIEFIQDTINPWCVRWEQGLKRQLLSDTEKRKYFFKHNLAGLMRGDFKTRMDGYAIARQNGWLSANDIREMEDMNPVEYGDLYLIPLNMVPAEQVANPPEPIEQQEPDQNKDLELNTIYRPLLQNAIIEIIKRERADIMREAEKNIKKDHEFSLEKFIRSFYQRHKAYMEQKLTPIYESLAVAVEKKQDTHVTDKHKAFASYHIDKFIERHISRSIYRLEEIAKKEDRLKELDAEFERKLSKAEEIAEEESKNFNKIK